MCRGCNPAGYWESRRPTDYDPSSLSEASSCDVPISDWQALRRGGRGEVGRAEGRDLHSFTRQLNLSAFYGIGGARRGCVARVKEVLGGV